ncbi:MAG: tRNA (adenosine(37)-N6)-dimethylallyltransferase MiaA, partial [Ignavibacteria bacterium]|nr:tRNA (adenosine(37)-N6)-dimethylallyltransferase MiaA [Ignavibacteria bacterium]
MTQSKKLIVITGPTASGKTNCAIELANHFNTEIISFDSRQFYKEMNIGTAKPTVKELSKAKHHFIGHLSIHDEYNAGIFGAEAEVLTEKLFQQHDTLIAVGGSGLFMRAWLDGLDEFPKVEEDVRNSLNNIFEEKGIASLQNLLREKDPEYFK